MKYSKSAIGLLTAQYRSVLKKCWMINVGLFALIGATFATPAEAGTDVNVAYTGGLNIVGGEITGTYSGTVNLTDYITETELGLALTDYVTETDLGSYAKTTDVTSALNGYYTKDEILNSTGTSGLLTHYYTKGELPGIIAAATVANATGDGAGHTIATYYATNDALNGLKSGGTAFSSVLIGSPNGATLAADADGNLSVNKAMQVANTLTIKKGDKLASLSADADGITADNFKAASLKIGSSSAITGVSAAANVTDGVIAGGDASLTTAAAVNTAISSAKTAANGYTDTQIDTLTGATGQVGINTAAIATLNDGASNENSVAGKIATAFSNNTAANMTDSTEQNKFAKVSQINTAIADAETRASKFTPDATVSASGAIYNTITTDGKAGIGAALNIAGEKIMANEDAITKMIGDTDATSISKQIRENTSLATYTPNSNTATIGGAIKDNADKIATLTATSGDGSIADMIKENASDADYDANSPTGSLGAKIADNASRIAANEGKLTGVTSVTGAIDAATRGVADTNLTIGDVADTVHVGASNLGLTVNNESDTIELSTSNTGENKTKLSLSGNGSASLGRVVGGVVQGVQINKATSGTGTIVSIVDGSKTVTFSEGAMTAEGATVKSLTLGSGDAAKEATAIDQGTNYAASTATAPSDAKTLASTLTVYNSVHSLVDQIATKADATEIHGDNNSSTVDTVKIGDKASKTKIGKLDTEENVLAGMAVDTAGKTVGIRVKGEYTSTDIKVAEDSIKIGNTGSGDTFSGIEFKGATTSDPAEVILGGGSAWVKATEGNLSATGNISTTNGTVSGKQLIAGTDGLVVDGKTLTSVDTGATIVPDAEHASATIIASQKTVRTALDEAQKYTPAGTSVVYNGVTTVAGALTNAGAAIDTLNGADTVENSVLYKIKNNAAGATYSGTTTIAEAIAANEARFAAGTNLPAFGATEKVADYLDNNAELAKYTPAGTGATPTTIQAAIRANDAKLAGLKLADASAADTVQAAIESFATKAKTDATAYTPTATVYSGATTVSGALDKAGVAIDTLNGGVGVENSVDYKVYNNAKDALYKEGTGGASDVTIAQAIQANTDTFGTLDVVSGQAATVGNAIAKAKADAQAYDPAAALKGDGAIFKDITTNKAALDKVGTEITMLEGDASTPGSVLKSVKDKASDATYNENSASGTLGGKITSNASRIAANEGKLAGITGTVTDYVKVNAELADFTPAGEGATKTTIQAAIRANTAKFGDLGTQTVKQAIDAVSADVSGNYVKKSYLVSGDSGLIKFGKEYNPENVQNTAANIGIDTNEDSSTITAQVRDSNMKSQSISLDAENGMILTSKQETVPAGGSAAFTETVTLKDGNVTASKKVSAKNIEATASVQGATLIATAATDGLTLNGTTASSIDNTGAAVSSEPTDSKTLASTKTVYSSVKALADGQVKLNKDAITKLNGTVDQDGSVLKSIKTTAKDAIYKPAGEDPTTEPAVTIAQAIQANTDTFGTLDVEATDDVTVENAIKKAKKEAQAYDPAAALKAEGAIFKDITTNKAALDKVGTEITKLEGADTVEGSVLNSIKGNAAGATYNAAATTAGDGSVGGAIKANTAKFGDLGNKTVAEAIADASGEAEDAIGEVLDGTRKFSKLSMGTNWSMDENSGGNFIIRNGGKPIMAMDKNGRLTLSNAQAKEFLQAGNGYLTLSKSNGDPYFHASDSTFALYDSEGNPRFTVENATGNIESNGTLTLKDATVGNQTLDAAKIKQITTNQTNIGDMSTLNGTSNAMVNRKADDTPDGAPATIVAALNNLSASIGDVHGLAADVAAGHRDTEGSTWYKDGAGNLYQGSDTDDHLAELAASIGDRSTYVTANAHYTQTATPKTNMSVSEAITNIDNNVYAAIGDRAYASTVPYLAAGESVTNSLTKLATNLKTVADDYVTKEYFNGGTAGTPATISMGANASDIVIGHTAAGDADTGTTIDVNHAANTITSSVVTAGSIGGPAPTTTKTELSADGFKVASTKKVSGTETTKKVVVADGNVTADETVSAKNLAATDSALVGTETGGTLTGVKLNSDGTVVASDSFTAGVAGTAPYSQITKGGATFAGANGMVTIADGSVTADGTTWAKTSLKLGAAGSEATAIDNLGDVISTQPSDGKTLASTLTVYNNVKDATTLTTAGNNYVANTAVKDAVAKIDQNMGNVNWYKGSKYANPSTTTNVSLARAIANLDTAAYNADQALAADIAKRKVTIATQRVGNTNGVEVMKVEDGTKEGTTLTLAGANTIFEAKQDWLDTALGIHSGDNAAADVTKAEMTGTNYLTEAASFTDAFKKLDAALGGVADGYVTKDYFNGKDGATVQMGIESDDVQVGKQNYSGTTPVSLMSGIRIFKDTSGTSTDRVITIGSNNADANDFKGIKISENGQTVSMGSLDNANAKIVTVKDGNVTADDTVQATKFAFSAADYASGIDTAGSDLNSTTSTATIDGHTIATTGTVKATVDGAMVLPEAGKNYAANSTVKTAIVALDTAMGDRNFADTNYAKLDNSTYELTKAITNLDTALYNVAGDYVTKSYFNNGETDTSSADFGKLSMGSGASKIEIGVTNATDKASIKIDNSDASITLASKGKNVVAANGNVTADGNVKGATLEATNSALVGTEVDDGQGNKTLTGVKLNSDGTVVASDSFTAGVAGTAPYSQITKGGATFAGANKTVSIADGTVTAAELALTSGSATAIDDTGNSIDLTTIVSDAEKATLASVGTVKATIKDATEVAAGTNYAAGTVKTAVADLDAAIGERTYTTAQPHLTTGQTVVASLKALDEAIVDISDDFVTWNYFNNGDTTGTAASNPNFGKLSMGSGAKEITVGSAADNIVVNTEDHQVKAAVAGSGSETKVEVNDGNIKIGSDVTNVGFSGMEFANNDKSVTFTSAGTTPKSVKIADGTVTADTSFKIGTASEATAFDNTTAAITSAVATADGAEKKMANIAEVYNTVNTNAEKSIFTPASDAVYVAGTTTINGAITALDVAADTNAKEIAKRKVTVDNKATLGKASNVQYAKVEDGTNEAEMLTIGGATAWLDSTLGIASSTTTPYATAFDGAHFITNNASTTMTSAIMDLDRTLYGIADDYVTWTYFNGGDATNNIVSMARNAKKTFIGAQTGTVDADNKFIPSAITTGVAIDTTTDGSHTIKVVANTTNGLSADASSAKLTAGTNAIISVASDGGIKLGTEVSGTLTGIAMTENGNNVTFNGLNKKVNVKNGVVTADDSVVVGTDGTAPYSKIESGSATFAGATGTVTIADGTVTNKKLVFSGDSSYATAIDNTGGVFSSTVTPSKYTLASTQTVYDNTTVAAAANGNYAAGSVIAALGSIDTAIGNRDFSATTYAKKDNASGELTKAITNLDTAIGEISDDYVTWDYFNGGEAATLPDGTTANPNAGLISMGSGAKNILIGKTTTDTVSGVTTLDSGLGINNTNGNVMLGQIAHLDAGDVVETGVNVDNANDVVSMVSANGTNSVNAIDVGKTTIKLGITTTDSSGGTSTTKFAGVTISNGVMTNVNQDDASKQSTLSSEEMAITDGINTSSVKADEVKVAASTTDYTSTTAAGTTVTKKDGDTTYTAKVEADKMSVTDGDNTSTVTATGVGVKDKDGNTADLTADGVSIKNKDGKHTADLTSTALTMDDSDNKTTVKADGMTVENTDAGTKTTVAAGSIEVKDANGTTKISGAGVETGSLKLGTSTQVATAISDGSAVVYPNRDDYGTEAEYQTAYNAAVTAAKSTLATNATVKATVDGVVADIEKQIHGDGAGSTVEIGDKADVTTIGKTSSGLGQTNTDIVVDAVNNKITLNASKNADPDNNVAGTRTEVQLDNGNGNIKIASSNSDAKTSTGLNITNDETNGKHTIGLSYDKDIPNTVTAHDGLTIDADTHQIALTSTNKDAAGTKKSGLELDNNTNVFKLGASNTPTSGTATSYGMTMNANTGVTKFEDQDGEGVTMSKGDLTATNSATVGDSSTANYAKIEEVKDATSGAVTGMKATFATQSGNTVIEDGSIKADHNITASDSVLAGSEDATSGALTGVKLKSDGTAQASTSVLAGTEDATSGALSGVKMNADGTLAASKSALVGVEAADGEYIKLETDATNGAKATFSSADGSVEVAKGEVTADNKVTVGDNTNSVVLDKGGNVTASNSALIGSETDDGQGNKTLTGVKMDKDGNAQASAKSTVGQVDANGDLSGNGVQMKNDGSATFASQDGNVKVSDGKVVADNEVTVGNASGTDYASVVKGTDGKVTATFASQAGNVVIGDGNVTAADGTVTGKNVVANTEFELAGTKVHSIDTGVDADGKPQKSAPAADALATTASVYANAEDGMYTTDNTYFVTAGADTINEALTAVDHIIGNFPAGLNKDLVDPTKTSSNLTNGGELEPATILDAFNNIDATMGTIHGLKAKHEAARLAQDGKVYHSNLEDGTTIEMHLSKLDDAIGDRTTITNENGSNNYAFSTDTMYVADVLTDLASQIGTAKDLGKEKNGVKASQTVNQNIAALNNTIGDVSELNNTEYAKGDTIVESIQSVDNKLSNLDTRMERAERDLKDVHHELRRGMASMAAMSALVPNSRSTGKTSLSVGTGAYSGHGAVAVGGFHYLTDNLMFNAGAAWSNSRDAVYRVGMTYSF